jgi:cytochrome P450
LGRSRLDFLSQVAREYGDCVHFHVGHWDYWFFTQPDAIKDVLVTNDGRFIKGPALRRTRDVLGNGLLTSEGELHRNQRRLIQPALHPQRVATYANLMTDYAVRAAAGWRDGQEIDLHHQMMQLTLRIVAKTLFDTELPSDVDQIGHSMDVIVKMFLRTMSPWGPIFNVMPLPSNFRFRRARNQLVATIDGLIADHRKADIDRGDLLSVLISASDAEGDHNEQADRQLRDEAITLFSAGHETTAVALTFTLYLLSQNPSARQALKEELNTVLGGRLPTAEDVEKLTYTRMVLSESMRLYPPAWAQARQALEPCTIDGYRVPKDAVVLICQWVTHRDPRWFPEPDKFDPTRFSPENRAARPRWAYFPFGGGSRQCIGESFAWMEAILVLATLVRQWDLEYMESHPPRVSPLITLRPSHPLRMRVRKG